MSTWCFSPDFMNSRMPGNKFDIDPYDGTPGITWCNFDERLLNLVASAVNKRGDEGGINCTPFPAAGQAINLREAQAAHLRRQKLAYAMLTKYVLDADHLTEMKVNYFQDGIALNQHAARFDDSHKQRFLAPELALGSKNTFVTRMSR
uniref:Uncharacterized protein n=1 Tax=Coccolithus braarudii TaxID=221442 RepID=A0A7S0LGA0_9EUKA|mmetsp:Transcript_38829/g.82733  ORF Transcript_38829/g.82733 Transcript_38829/m.82733 type:complete len:148 (+) Transcript_38829:57-500(+)